MALPAAAMKTAIEGLRRSTRKTGSWSLDSEIAALASSWREI